MLCEHVRSLVTFPLRFQIEKSQGEIYRLRAKLESTQSENENMADELEKMQRALNQSYSDRDRIGSDLDKLRDDLERSQVMNYAFFLYTNRGHLFEELLDKSNGIKNLQTSALPI